ncbi:MAG: histidine--tRNA ligase [Candidatus Saccharimonadales bacterium]
MSLSTQPYKGARDFYPEDKRLQKYIFDKLRQVVESFGYQEYDAPILEPLDIYLAKTGEEIVNEQLYSFVDRGGRRVAIRPEMTPSVSRMVAGRRQELAYPLRWYSIANFWRYERPQRGRLREHYQLNADIFGVEGVAADAEIIQVADSILKSLGAKAEMYRININSRVAMIQAMKEFGLEGTELKAVYKLVDKMPKLTDEDFKKVLSENLSAEKATKLLKYLDNNQPPEKVDRLLSLLKSVGVTSATYEPSVVRGLEYYTDIVFEVFDTNPENARALFGGGRYDGLVGLFGVEPLPTVGFGMGDVTLQNFLEAHKLLPKLQVETDAIVVLIGDLYESAQSLLAQLRESGLKLAVDSSGRKLDAQLKSADKSGVKHVIFIGEAELKSKKLKLKNLQTGDERQLSAEELVKALQS